MEVPLFRKMDFSLARWKVLQKTVPLILAMDDEPKFLQAFAAMLCEVFALRWASLALRDRAQGLFRIRGSSGRLEALAEGAQAPSLDQAARWLEDRQKVMRRRLISEFGNSFSTELKTELNKNDTFVSLPLFVKEQLTGIINLGPKSGSKQFSRDELDVLADLGPLFAAVIKKACDYSLMQKQSAYRQAVLHNLVSGVIAVDAAGRISIFNHAAERILKLKAEKMLGEDIRRFPDNLSQLLLETLEKGKSLRREQLRLLRANTWVGASSSQFYNAQGKLLGAYLVFCNLDRIRKQQQIVRQQRMSSYWAKMAREINDSLTGTKAHTELFPKKYEDAEFRWNLYSTLKQDMQKMDSLTQRIIEFAQEKPLAIQSCSVEKLINEALDLGLQGKEKNKSIVEKSYSDNLKFLPGDYHQLKLAFIQLINNSLEAMPEGGKLRISAELERGPEMLIYNLPDVLGQLPEAEVVAVKIQDSGPGISARDLPRIFEPFFTTKEARPGLGLAIAQKNIERHQGVIRVFSRPGAGCTFWVCLPVLNKEDFVCKYK